MGPAPVSGCPDDDLLGALAAGDLPPSEREAIAIHAASCAACHAVIGFLADADDATDDGRAGADTGDLALGPGTAIGRYTIETRIGAGGMGVVYAATDRELERRVALKFLRRGTRDPAARTRLVREARTLARLSHRNIVTLFDAGEHRGHVFVVMELVDGGHVKAWCAQRSRSTDEILDCMLAAGRGLAAAHAAGVVHRDVKPDNILVGRDDGVRVTDFGLARLELDPSTDASDDATPSSEPPPPSLTRTGAILGTPAYMAPEALRGIASPLADQWAYCATFYEVLAGTRPFPDDALARARDIANGTLAPPAPGRRIPGRVRAVLARGLREDPSARWPNMNALVATLGHARTRPRARTIAAIAVTATLVAGATTTAFAWRPWARRAADPAHAWFVWNDERPGCDCPLSACTGRCVSQCDAPAYRVGDPLPGISVANRQEALLGASERGDVVLFLAGEGCATDHLFLARRTGQTYVEVDLTDQLDRARVELWEGCCTLSADGARVIATARGRQAFVEARIDGDRLAPWSPLLALPLPERARLGFPVLSADGRTLYYKLDHPGDEPGTAGPLDGLRQAERDDVVAPFQRSRPIPGSARRYGYVTGVSADGLSLFLADEFQTRVLARATVDDMFVEPTPTFTPVYLAGWRSIPIDGCRRVMTTLTPGGCHNEDIGFLELHE